MGMDERKLLVIIGITGNQGGSVARTFLNDPGMRSKYRLRGISYHSSWQPRALKWSLPTSMTQLCSSKHLREHMPSSLLQISGCLISTRTIRPKLKSKESISANSRMNLSTNRDATLPTPPPRSGSWSDLLCPWYLAPRRAAMVATIRYGTSIARLTW